MNQNSPDVRHARIAWRCRRGMRELDLLLGRFLAAGLGALGREDLGRLEMLLEHPDQDILAWLTGRARPGDADTRAIVGILRRSIEQSSDE